MTQTLFRGCPVEDLPVPVVQCEAMPFGEKCQGCEGPTDTAEGFILGEGCTDLGGTFKTRLTGGEPLYERVEMSAATNPQSGHPVLRAAKSGASMALTFGAVAVAVVAGGLLYWMLVPKLVRQTLKD